MLAQDLVEHFENRVDAMDGKAMVVCMSRRICVSLYEQIKKIRPGWHSDDNDAGKIKVVMTGSASDPPNGNNTWVIKPAVNCWPYAPKRPMTSSR